ncbi:MAG: proline dehydrogenase family protein, partial [Gaiellaceae bacterium]
MAGLLKRAILLAATNRLVTAFVQRHAMRLGASRFVAGETLGECVGVLRRLNEQGLRANTTLLGEDVTDETGAGAAVSAYEEILDRIAQEALRVNVALKLTHLGLGLGEELAYDNASRVVNRAADHGNFVRIDMERSSVVDATYESTAACVRADLTTSAVSCRRICAAASATSPSCCPCGRTFASSRAPISSPPMSHTRARQTSTARTRASSRPR